METLAARIAALDWSGIERSLWAYGHARTPPVLTPDECTALAALSRAFAAASGSARPSGVSRGRASLQDSANPLSLPRRESSSAKRSKRPRRGRASTPSSG